MNLVILYYIVKEEGKVKEERIGLEIMGACSGCSIERWVFYGVWTSLGATICFMGCGILVWKG